MIGKMGRRGAGLRPPPPGSASTKRTFIAASPLAGGEVAGRASATPSGIGWGPAEEMDSVTTRRPRTLALLLTTGAVLGAAAFAAVQPPALAGPGAKPRKRGAVVGRVVTPLGLQGARGTGTRVVIPFTLIDATRAPADIEVEYGFDGSRGPVDGTIGPDEYFRATEDRLDPRNTRRNRKPQTYSTSADIGASHGFVWRSEADIASGRYETLQYRYTPQGRLVPDPDHPGSFLFAPSQPGVKIRIRAVSGSGKKRVVGPWVESDAFSLNNNNAPSMSIDAVLPNATSVPTASDEHVLVKWTAADPDSEDLNGNGIFEPQLGEDLNGDEVAQLERMGVAFDHAPLLPGQNPATMSDEELAALAWQPCTRAPEADTDALPSGPADPAITASPIGRQYTFAWDSVADVGTVHGFYALRATPVDEKYENGATVYLRERVLIDNWKIFSPGVTKSSGLAMASARTGVTITNLVPGLERSDPNYGDPFQQVIVAGGQTSATGNGTPTVDLFLLSQNAAPTTEGSQVGSPQFQFTTPRTHHTATLLSDGRVLFAGGFDANGNPTSTTEIYDPLTRTMSPGPDLLAPRARHAAVLLTTNQVAFFGGIGEGGATLASCEVHNFTAAGEPLAPNTALPDLPVAQHSAAAHLLPDQRVLVVAGLDAGGACVTQGQILEPLYDSDPVTPATKTPRFVPTANTMGAARRFVASTSLPDGNVLFTGGSESAGTALATMEVYNAAEASFEPVTLAMPDGPRAQHFAATLGDGTVLISGGTTNPDSNSAPILGAADVFRIGARAAGQWSGTFLPVNGDMVAARRLASTAVIMQGRVVVAGGLTSSNQPTTDLETYVPENSANYAPRAYVLLPTTQLSWKYGATLHYRVYDPEGDAARVVVQYRAPGATTWSACSPQASTIGGDVAEGTAGLATTTQNLTNTDLAIDPIAGATPGDHVFIWSMQADIERPAPGQVVTDYNLRVVPFGAVRGVVAISEPVTVLYNTKPITTILPLENLSDGQPNPFQGGDIRLNVHVRDIDGVTEASNGDPVSVLFEYAVDANDDGQISGADGEFFYPMTPAGNPSGLANPNPLTGVQSWGQPAEQADAGFGQRPAAKGWVAFDWDALYDLGPASSALAFQHRNVWARVTATDSDAGFPKILRNRPGQPDEFVYTRHPGGVWLQSFVPRGGDAASVRPNEPIDFIFNGDVDPASVGPSTIRVYNGASPSAQVLGRYVTSPGTGTTTVTFHPQPQNLSLDAAVYSATSTDTVYFPGVGYRIEIPGYAKGDDPAQSAATTVRSVNSAAETSTYLRVNNTSPDGDADAQYRFSVTAGHYDDGLVVTPTGSAPGTGGTLPSQTGTISLTFDHAIDASTVNSTNIPVLGTSVLVPPGTGSTGYVVPGRWTVTNTVAADGSTSATLTFTPLTKLPASGEIAVTSTDGLKGTNGATAGTVPVTTIGVPAGDGRTTASFLEDFSSTTNRDASGTDASWGTDACNPGALTGFQDGALPPQGGAATTISSTITYTGPTVDLGSLTITKTGRLNLRSTSGPFTLRVKGNVLIDGILDFAGDEGYSGQHGNNISYSNYYYQGTTKTSGNRVGGAGYNGGGSGGNSVTDSTSLYSATPGADGADGSSGGGGGDGGTVGTISSGVYGGGGGAGGGHANRGINGGQPTGYGLSTTYGLQSVGGVAGGEPNMGSGPSAGGGGGGGATRPYTSGYYTQGGGGGAGAGAVTILCDGTFTLGVTGIINGRGGQGGSKHHVAGAGGGGAGGGLHIKAGGVVKLDGLIDLRGGRGGPPSFGYQNDSYQYLSMSTYGACRYGGDGSPGRVVVAAPNFLATNEIRCFGQLVTRQITTIPSPTTSQLSVPSAFSTTGGTGVFAVNLNGVTEVRYATLDVVANRTVVLTNSSTPTTTSGLPLRIYVDGTVNIAGVIQLNGGGPADYAVSSLPAELTGTNNLYISGNRSPLDAYPGYLGALGGGRGGAASNSSGGNYGLEGGDGTGPSSANAGKHKIRAAGGWSNYYSGHSGGSGGGNASEGADGWCPYGIQGGYNPLGNQPGTSGQDTNNTGVSPTQRALDSAPRGARIDPSLVSTTNTSSFVGSGGGGGNAGGYPYYWAGYAGRGGGGGGGLVIITPGTMNISGRLEAKGGNGNPPGFTMFTSSNWNEHSAGGGGSGGMIHLVADRMALTTVTTGEGAAADGATFDVSGGQGGGWRQPVTGIRGQRPWYASGGHFGGDGGFGRVVLEYRTALTDGNGISKTPVNRWGMEQSTFHDAHDQYRALAGTARFVCRGTPGLGTFRSTWQDTGSLRPVFSSLAAGTASNVATFTLQGQGAQSHRQAVGGGTGMPDTANVSALADPGTGFLDGWRWWRFSGSFTRLGATSPAPIIDNVMAEYETDD